MDAMKEYKDWLAELKTLIRSVQQMAFRAVNQELILLYWEIGKSISHEISNSEWGTAVVEKLSLDLKREFPGQRGFSRSNLFYMKKFFEFYFNSNFSVYTIQQLVGQIPWGHNVIIITRARSIEEAVYYGNEVIQNNWSRSVLNKQFESNLYLRKGQAVTNFDRTMSNPYSSLVHDTFKDPYIFDFLNIQEKALEKDLEDQLINHITSFLLELGSGFSFVGRQIVLKIDQKDFYLDLLFYQIKLKCYVVIELKTTEFKAEYAGKMNFYLSAVDELIKTETDNETIGLLICKSKSKIIAEYTLRGMSQPIGISQYQIENTIPARLKTNLPTIEEIEKELSGELGSFNQIVKSPPDSR